MNKLLLSVSMLFIISGCAAGLKDEFVKGGDISISTAAKESPDIITFYNKTYKGLKEGNGGLILGKWNMDKKYSLLNFDEGYTKVFDLYCSAKQGVTYYWPANLNNSLEYSEEFMTCEVNGQVNGALVFKTFYYMQRNLKYDGKLIVISGKRFDRARSEYKPIKEYENTKRASPYK